jgi:hypothetical protein
LDLLALSVREALPDNWAVRGRSADVVLTMMLGSAVTACTSGATSPATKHFGDCGHIDGPE